MLNELYFTENGPPNGNAGQNTNNDGARPAQQQADGVMYYDAFCC